MFPVKLLITFHTWMWSWKPYSFTAQRKFLHGFLFQFITVAASHNCRHQSCRKIQLSPLFMPHFTDNYSLWFVIDTSKTTSWLLARDTLRLQIYKDYYYLRRLLAIVFFESIHQLHHRFGTESSCHNHLCVIQVRTGIQIPFRSQKALFAKQSKPNSWLIVCIA